MADSTSRRSWDDYFMRIAQEVATRATCDRKHVGAVLTRHKTILATGYNGSIRGLEHCDDAGHLMEDGHCVRTIHAEANAVVQAAGNGVRIDGATAYITASPCRGCFGLLANAGIVRIVFGEAYRPEDPGPKWVVQAAEHLGIVLDQHKSGSGLKAVWHRDHAASGKRSRAWFDDNYELLAYDDGCWEVRAPPSGCAVAGDKAVSHAEAQATAIRVYKALTSKL